MSFAEPSGTGAAERFQHCATAEFPAKVVCDAADIGSAAAMDQQSSAAAIELAQLECEHGDVYSFSSKAMLRRVSL